MNIVNAGGQGVGYQFDGKVGGDVVSGVVNRSVVVDGEVTGSYLTLSVLRFL